MSRFDVRPPHNNNERDSPSTFHNTTACYAKTTHRVMACPLLDKLAPELREKIYGYVLHFDDVPLRHATQLQPFVKKLTGVDGELPFAYEDSAKRAPELEWIACDGLFGGIPKIDTAILSTCKTIYNEGKRCDYYWVRRNNLLICAFPSQPSRPSTTRTPLASTSSSSN
jgi:hypothetical protein